MSARRLPQHEEMLDLLALRAVEGLGVAEEHRLGELFAEGDSATEILEADLFDEAAAVLTVGLLGLDGLQSMPAGLGERVVAAREETDLESLPDEPIARIAGGAVMEGSDTGRGVPGWVAACGWLVAAACLAVAFVVSAPGGAAIEEPSLEARLAAIESKAGVVRTAWVGLDDAELAEAPHRFDQELSGEVIWDPEIGEGYMVFEGLTANDPEAFQYQLWIFDANRPTGQLPQFGEGILSQRPVDGGVFDVTADGRVIIPIDAKLPVGQAAVFAVTVEPPGGVVVSDRDIVTLAIPS